MHEYRGKESSWLICEIFCQSIIIIILKHVKYEFFKILNPNVKNTQDFRI